MRGSGILYYFAFKKETGLHLLDVQTKKAQVINLIVLDKASLDRLIIVEATDKNGYKF